MKQHVALLFLFLVLAVHTFGAELNPDEAKHLLLRASKLKEAFDKGDAETIIEMTHPSIYALTNGKEGFEKMTRTGMEQLRSLGITILDSSLGVPTPTYASGSDTVCFVPRISVMSVQGKKAKSTGFLIAIRSGNKNEWLFLDGSGLRKNPTLLKTLLPGLPEEIKLPENRVEKIE